MLQRQHSVRVYLAGVAAFAVITSITQGAYVTPKIGGGQVMHAEAPMKHTDVFFDGVNITLHVDDTVATPILRPLTPPDEFDPNQPWSDLGYQAYNFQWAWNPGGVISLPAGAAICMERIYQDPEFTVYLRTPMYDPSIYGPKWPEIFTEDGYRWMWSGAMQHNVYAICGPEKNAYSATYKVYLGDATTLEPLEGYGSAIVTWIWNATLAGDMNCDGLLNGEDVQAFVLALMDPTGYAAAYPTCRYYNADCNCDGLVDTTDAQAFVAALLGQ
jgi:hypothetical protein